jgi:uncharacterized protein YjiS (DUF1127 family)
MALLNLISSNATGLRSAPSFRTWFTARTQVMRERAALRDLSDERLQDLGISRHEAEEEANRPFWDAPDTWRR